VLEVEYEILRKEGENHQRIFNTDPKLRKINGNAVYIKAPNARGKSTFLNIIALALYGDRLEDSDCRISKSLRSDIQYMASRQNQDYTFNLVLTSKDGKIKLISSKEDPVSKDITIKEIIDDKETYIPLQTFKEKYFLVYDIPEDPLNHITEILSEVKNEQNRYHYKISNFRNYLGEVKSEIAHSRNDQEIERLKFILSEYTDKETKINDATEELQEEIGILELYLSLREFEKYIQNSLYLMQAIDIENKNKSKNRTNVKRFNTQYENKKEKIVSNINKIKKSVYNLSCTLEQLFINRGLDEVKLHTDKIKAIKWEECIKTYTVNSKICSEFLFFKKKINNYLGEKNIRESGKKGSFYQELINVFKQYRSIEISIPGFDKSIDEFIQLLEKEYDNNKTFKYIYDDLHTCLEIISETESEIENLQQDLESLRMLSDKRDRSLLKNDDEKIDNNIAGINQELQPIIEKIDYYKNLAKKNNMVIDENSDPGEIINKREQILAQYPKYSNVFMQGEESFIIEIQNRGKKLEEHKRKQNEILNIKVQTQDKLKTLESKEPHKYHSHATKIDRLSKLIDTLDKNFAKYDEIINKISKGDKLNSEIEKQYNEAISHYFANKIPEFPYIDEFLKPTKIDFLNKSILLEDGREIDMKDISTGQSMSMYIQAILNRPEDDKRRMIVIFDEGATMDSNSLKPIQNILAKQIKQNKILMAVFAKAVDNDLTIEELC